MSTLRRQQAGFTIVELMVATLVFSMVLLVITIGVLSFTNAYYRGVTQSSTQNTARLILENISQAIQFSGLQVTSPITGTGNTRGFCLGDQRYSFLLGYQLVDGTPKANQSKHALMQDAYGDCSGASAQDLQSSGTLKGEELLSPHMRLAKLSVTPLANNLYSVTIRVVYGDDDLLVSPSGKTPAATAPDATCKGSAGAQFCAVSELSTVVQKRITTQ